LLGEQWSSRLSSELSYQESYEISLHTAAFTVAEREDIGLTGRLPSAVLTLDQQAQRAYQQLQVHGSDLAKNVYIEQPQELVRTGELPS
jgi:hypothetical protein